MDCFKNRLSSGVDDPDMEVGSVRARPRDVFGISVLLTLLLAILLAMWTVGVEDPHGLSHATPVRAADVPSLEPLYGAVQTPWRSLDWSPDGRQIALTGGSRSGKPGPESSSGACSTRPSGARPRTGHRMATTSRSMRSAGRPSTTPSRAGPSSSARPRKRWMSGHPRGPTRETASHPRT